MSETEPAITWHRLSPQDVVNRLHTDPESGLSQAEAVRRLKQHGPNILAGSAQL